MMPTSRRIILIFLVASILTGIVSGSSFYYRLAYLWIFIFVGSFMMSRLSLYGVTFKRSARSLRSQVGQIFEERFEIYNHSRIPRLWIEIRDECDLPGSRGSQVLSLVGGRETRSYLVRTRLMERGVFPLGKTVLASGDLFGMFPVSRAYDAQESLLVYPMIVQLSAFPSPQGWLSGGEALRRRTQQITANAAGVREYASGDPLNRIHWLSTARRNRLIVKEFELDPLAEVWIFIDASQYVHVELPRPELTLNDRDIWRPAVKIPLPPSTEEYSVTIAASLARYYLERGRVVGLVSSGQTFRVLPAERGGRQLGKILEALALLRAHGRLPLQGLVETEARNLPRGSTVILITPDTRNDLLVTVELLTRRGMRPVVVLLDAVSFGGIKGPDELANNLQILGIPICKVCNGDDLSEILSAAGRAQLWL